MCVFRFGPSGPDTLFSDVAQAVLKLMWPRLPCNCVSGTLFSDVAQPAHPDMQCYDLAHTTPKHFLGCDPGCHEFVFYGLAQATLNFGFLDLKLCFLMRARLP